MLVVADVAFSHPELARRWDLLVKRSWVRSWDVYIESSTRSYQTQLGWWEQFMAGLWPAQVADPKQDWGPSPFGWEARGSLHMTQYDGYSHALDIGWTGPHDWQVHDLARTCGLRFPEPGEDWHAQWWGLDGVYPVEEDDMTLEQYMRGIGRVGEDLGCLKIIDGVINQKLSDGNWYTLADRDEFIHRKLYPIAPPQP